VARPVIVVVCLPFFSGLLRMSDLITMQPNINIPLYIVAPNERRNKVIVEVNRPTFAMMHGKGVDCRVAVARVTIAPRRSCTWKKLAGPPCFLG
jgi:hypothetical protein